MGLAPLVWGGIKKGRPACIFSRYRALPEPSHLSSSLFLLPRNAILCCSDCIACLRLGYGSRSEYQQRRGRCSWFILLPGECDVLTVALNSLLVSFVERSVIFMLEYRVALKRAADVCSSLQVSFAVRLVSLVECESKMCVLTNGHI